MPDHNDKKSKSIEGQDLEPAHGHHQHGRQEPGAGQSGQELHGQPYDQAAEDKKAQENRGKAAEENDKNREKREKAERGEGEPSDTPDPQPWPTAPIAMTNPRGPATHIPLEEESDESKEAKTQMEEID